MDPIFAQPNLMVELGRQLTHQPDVAFDVIVSPAVGGVALAQAASFAMLERHNERRPGIWADKDGDGFVFDRLGFAPLLDGKRVLVVEDLLTTGGSVIKVCRAAEACNATIVAVSAVCNRGGVTAEDLGVPLLCSLAEVNFEAVDADNCPHCAAGEPIVVDAALGHGAAYRADHPNYAGGFAELLTAA